MNDYLTQLEEQLAELTERGAHRRPRRRSEALAFLAAAAVAAAVVAIVVLNVGTGTPHRTSAPATAGGQHAGTATAGTGTMGNGVYTIPQTTSAPSPATPTLPSRFYPQSFTAISELSWWVLGPAPCALAGLQSPCGAILRTTDGGRTFTPLQAPRASLAGRLSSSGYSQVRFADPLNGFAYGPDLYATHDGGTTWSPVDVGGAVNDLAISAGVVYATVSPNDTDSGRLMRSPVGRDQWTTVSAAGQVSAGLWAQGANVLVQSGNGAGYGNDLLVSHDGGATFATYPAPSPGLPCQFEGAAAPDVWAYCATGTESGVWLSHDGGATFASAEPAGAHLSLPNSAAFGAASGTTAVVGYQQLYRTADNGATWMPVGPSGIAQWVYIGFSDPTHGVAIGYVGSISTSNERLYYTTDGGQTYHLVQVG